jgi:hypothetical protein
MTGWLKLKLIALFNIMIDKSLIEWLLDADVSIQYQVYRDLFDMEQQGKASRWNTLRALRVLKHFGLIDRMK